MINAILPYSVMGFRRPQGKVLAFKGKKDDAYSYENFRRNAEKANLRSSKDLEREIKSENLIGTGAHSRVYKFSDPNLDNWVLKVENNHGIHEGKDQFEGLNMGQEIAATWNRYSILKKVQGEPHSVKDWSARATNGSFYVSPEETMKFIDDIGGISKFPQSSFDAYAQKLKALSESGYKMDSINPNNLLIDYTSGEINIIDYFHPSKYCENSKQDLIMPLLDFSSFRNYYRNTVDSQSRRRLMEASEEIIRKCTIAAQKAGIPTGDERYRYYLEWIDGIYGMENTPNSHMERYRYMCKLFPGLR